MAHYAKLNSSNEVLAVHVVDNANSETEAKGIEYLTGVTGYTNWKQTSYNTQYNVHLLGGTPFRKNFAGKGYTYDEAKDAFIAPQNYSSWILNETTCQWEAPVAKPELTQEQFDNDLRYHWNDENQTWDLVDISELR